MGGFHAARASVHSARAEDAKRRIAFLLATLKEPASGRANTYIFSGVKNA